MSFPNLNTRQEKMITMFAIARHTPAREILMDHDLPSSVGAPFEYGGYVALEGLK